MFVNFATIQHQRFETIIGRKKIIKEEKRNLFGKFLKMYGQFIAIHSDIDSFTSVDIYVLGIDHSMYFQH